MAHKTSNFLNIFPQNFQIMLSLAKKFLKTNFDKLFFSFFLFQFCILFATSIQIQELCWNLKCILNSIMKTTLLLRTTNMIIMKYN